MKFEGDVSIGSVIRKLKLGARMFPNSNWVAASSVAGLVGVASLLLAFKDRNLSINNSLLKLSDNDCSSEKLLLVPGLQNLGNNCFLNVILQALASCSSFRTFLGNILDDLEYMFLEEKVESFPLLVELASLLEELCVVRHGPEVLSPQRVMVALTQYIPKFNLTSQQDAEEAFFHILSFLRKELSDCFVLNRSSLAEIPALSDNRLINPWRGNCNSYPERWRRTFLGPFDGILASNLYCGSCSHQVE